MATKELAHGGGYLVTQKLNKRIFIIIIIIYFLFFNFYDSWLNVYVQRYVL